MDEPGDRSDGHSHLHALAGWQVELYADAESPASLAYLLVRLPAVCIDHLGLSRAGRPILLRPPELAERVLWRNAVEYHRPRASLCA